jgi:hypothetical protein
MFVDDPLPELPPLSDSAKVEILAQALNDINKIVYGQHIVRGSAEYFAIRKECVDTLCICGIKVQ